MSKKNNNGPKNTEIEEPIVDEVVETTAVEETPSEVTEEVPVEEAPVEEVAAEPVVTEVKEEPKVVEPVEPKPEIKKADEVDPNPEVSGNYYVTVGFSMDERELELTEEKIKRAGQNYVVTATGEILVGPFEDEDAAMAGRLSILQKGLRGDIKTF